MGVTNLLPGVKVPKLVAGSVAELAGMRKGDVIVAVGDHPISSSRENVNRLVQYIK
jgi:S1-C subfamily serine protease